MHTNEEVAKRVEADRRSAGVPLLTLAKATGIARTTLRRQLAGLAEFKVSDLMRISRHLNVPVEKWLNGLDFTPGPDAPKVLDRYETDEAGCWIWRGYTDPTNGYGSHGDSYAHRTFYEKFKGEIPAGLTIDHLCRVRNCVNPDHLEAVTLRENILRSDGPTAINARKTHCKHGHEFNAENTRTRGTWRDCITCCDINNKRNNAARAAA